MDWKEYELAVFDLIKSEHPNAVVTHDVHLDGLFSKKSRQIDVLVEHNIGGRPLRTIIDAKFYNRKVDVKGVESFIGMLGDVQADRGILVSPLGFSDAAAKRAFYDHAVDIEVEIFNFNDLHRFQAFGAIPYAGKHGVLLTAPLGWVVDGARNPMATATLYRRGQSLEEAQNNAEFMYINFWDRAKDNESLQDLVKKQEGAIITSYGNIEISYSHDVTHTHGEALIRKVALSNAVVEYTAFVSFEEFVFFAVLITPVEMSKKNLRKLQNLTSLVIPVKIESS